MSFFNLNLTRNAKTSDGNVNSNNNTTPTWVIMFYIWCVCIAVMSLVMLAYDFWLINSYTQLIGCCKHHKLRGRETFIFDE